MNNQWNRLTLVLGTALVVASFESSALAQSGSSETSGTNEGIANDGVIPTVLVDEPESQGPPPVCRMCEVKDVEVNEASTGSDSATLELHFDNEGLDVLADVRATVLLFDGEYRTITISSVQLVHGTDYEFELSSGDDWIWEEVSFTWIEIQ